MPPSLSRTKLRESSEKDIISLKRTTVSSQPSAKSNATGLSGNHVAPWRALFYFTTRSHLPSLIIGLVSAVICGVAAPAQSLLLGKAFGLFSKYATGNISGDDLLLQEKRYVYYMLAIGLGSWVAHFVFFTCWLAFGELQAKSARDRLFNGLLLKEIEWYDQRKNGVAALISRLQM